MATTRIQLRRDFAATWTNINPVLALGEEGWERDTGKRKVGDGVTAWTGLPYDGGDASALEPRVDELEGDTALLLVGNVKNYGATGDGVTNDTAAINLAKNALPDGRGELFFPDGGQYVHTALNFDGAVSVTMRGSSGASGLNVISSPGRGSSQLVFIGTGTTPAISARATRGFHIRDLEIVYTSALFTGVLVDFSGTNNLAGVTVFPRTTNVGLLDGGNRTAAALMKLTHSVDGSFRAGRFIGGVIGVLGRDLNSEFANAHSFYGCRFQDNVTLHTKNAAEGWNFYGCIFENLADVSAGAYGHDAGVRAKGVKFDGCWFGDALTAGGTQIRFAGSGLTVSAGRMGIEADPSTGIEIDEDGCDGIVVIGVPFVCAPAASATAIDFGTTVGHTGVIIAGNEYEAGVIPIAGTVPSPALIQNADGNLLDLDVVGTVDVSTYLQTYAGTTAAILLGNNGGQPGIFLGNLQDVVVSRLGTATPTLSSQSPLTLPTFTVATRPAAANVTAGTMIYVSDAAAGARFQGQHGGAWVNLG